MLLVVTIQGITEVIQDLLTDLLVVILHHLGVYEIILLEIVQVQEALEDN